jgi:penicillin-binding protein 2
MNQKHSVGHAFSDHVFEERLRRKKGFTNPHYGLYRFIPLLILCLVFVLLAMRLFTLQIVRASYYSRLSDANRIRTVLIPAPRGIIFDRNGNALVRNIPAFGILQNNKIEWLNREDAMKKVTKGQNVLAIVKRDYLYKDLFSHVLGYVGQVNSDELLLPDYKDYGISDFTGRMGLEEQYEKFLHGQNGKQLYEVNAKGERIRLLGEEEARQGAVIRTTLDTDLQKAAANAMSKIEKGAVVVTDPRDGSVLALYSKPSFDPNLFTRESSYESTGAYKKKENILLDNVNFPLLDRAISGVYPPGSTFKIVTSIAALSSGKITEDTEIEDTGILSVGGSNFGTWAYLEYGKKEGLLDVRRAIVRSNDIFFYHIGMKTGIDTLSSWARQVGLGGKSGIDLPGEVKGTVPGPSWKEKVIGEQWYLGDTINTSIGQGFLEATPIQVNRYTQLVANGGQLLEPHLLLGNVNIEKQDFIKKKDLEIIKDGMKGACETGGTGYPLFGFKVNPPAGGRKLKVDGLDYVKDASAGANFVHVTMGCKTGTSESHGYEAKSHAWFTVFAPFYNPEIAITVLAENAGQGSDVAAPVARDIMRVYFERK